MTAFSVRVAQRVTIALGFQPAASSVKSIRRVGGEQYFRGEKKLCIDYSQAGIDIAEVLVRRSGVVLDRGR